MFVNYFIPFTTYFLLFLAVTNSDQLKVGNNSQLDLAGLLNDKNQYTRNLLKTAFNNLVGQITDTVENLTAIQNHSATVFQTIKDLNSSLSKGKQSDLPNKRQLTDLFTVLLDNHEQEVKTKSKLGSFVDGLKDIGKILNDPRGIENAFLSLITTALLKSNFKKLQDDYGISSNFLDGVLGLFKKDVSTKDVLNTLFNPCERQDCGGLKAGFEKMKKLAILANNTSIMGMLNNPNLLASVFNLSNMINASKNGPPNDVKNPTLLDKIVDFFNNPKAALQSAIIPTKSDKPQQQPNEEINSKPQSGTFDTLVNMLSSLFKPKTDSKMSDSMSSGRSSQTNNRSYEHYYDTLYGHNPDHNLNHDF